MQSPPDAETLWAIIAKLEDPPTALVRRDSKFRELELGDADVATEDQIVDILVKHKQLLQRPLVVTEGHRHYWSAQGSCANTPELDLAGWVVQDPFLAAEP